jgi:formylglycine-generating enzyme required for sulfatase activity
MAVMIVLAPVSCLMHNLISRKCAILIEVLMSLVDTDSSSARPQQHTDMLVVPGSTFRMGSDRHYPEEAPVDWKRIFTFEGK